SRRRHTRFSREFRRVLFRSSPDEGAAWREKRPWLRGRTLITYPGTFGKINGVGYMVRLATALLKTAPDVRILLVGDGMEKPLVRSEERRVGKDGRVWSVAVE